MKKKDFVDWIDISDVWDSPPASDLTFVDLFSGAGGLSKGFEMAGLNGVCGLDYFPAAAQTYRRNFKHAFVEGDIKTPETKARFYETVNAALNRRSLSLLAGGFPCQGFSMAGKRSETDARNELYKELLEIVTELKPEFVVCENVVGLRSMLDGAVERLILRDFEAAGYRMNITVLRAADYCVPQKRYRVIFIGNRINKTNYYPYPILIPFFGQSQYITTGQAIGDLIERSPSEYFNHITPNHQADMIKRMAVLKSGKSLYPSYSDAWYKLYWDSPSCTIKTDGNVIHPKLPRCLTAREMARIQSFPDDFIFEGKRNKQLV